VEREERLKSWVRLYSERLVRIALMYVKDQSTAEDRVQNGFIKAYQSMDKLKEVDNPANRNGEFKYLWFDMEHT
jgi:RNA polymerase sigma-70 factor (ECF subfamily)